MAFSGHREHVHSTLVLVKKDGIGKDGSDAFSHSTLSYTCDSDSISNEISEVKSLVTV